MDNLSRATFSARQWLRRDIAKSANGKLRCVSLIDAYINGWFAGRAAAKRERRKR